MKRHYENSQSVPNVAVYTIARAGRMLKIVFIAEATSVNRLKFRTQENFKSTQNLKHSRSSHQEYSSRKLNKMKAGSISIAKGRELRRAEASRGTRYGAL